MGRLYSGLLQLCVVASALPSVTSRRISASDTGIFANIAKEIDQPSEPAAAASGQQPLPRLLACALMKNEVPYVVEWVEFHRVMVRNRPARDTACAKSKDFWALCKERSCKPAKVMTLWQCCYAGL